jgi:biotin transport system substrate-specific component
VAWIAWGPASAGIARAIAAGLVPFLPADLLKIVLAAAVLPSAWRLIGTRP